VQSDLATPEITSAQAIFGLVGVLASLALAWPVTGLARALFPGRNVVFARWGFSHVALAALFFVGLGVTGGAVLSLAGVSEEIHDDALAVIVYGAAIQTAVVLLVVGFARKLDPEGARSLGLRAERSAPALAVGLAAYVAAFPGILGVMSAWSWLLQSFDFDAKPQELIGLALDLEGWRLGAFAVFAVAVVPFLEEVLFRGFLQPLLVQNLGDRGGVVVTAVVFAASHLNVFAFVPLLAIALVLGAVMLRTQRIAASWLVHASHNGVMILLLVLTRSQGAAS
jgi:membrane protease YdiL (CAAX protease family)